MSSSSSGRRRICVLRPRVVRVSAPPAATLSRSRRVRPPIWFRPVDTVNKGLPATDFLDPGRARAQSCAATQFAPRMSPPAVAHHHPFRSGGSMHTPRPPFQVQRSPIFEISITALVTVLQQGPCGRNIQDFKSPGRSRKKVRTASCPAAPPARADALARMSTSAWSS